MSLFCSLQLIRAMRSEIQKSNARRSFKKMGEQNKGPPRSRTFLNTRLSDTFGHKGSNGFENKPRCSHTS